MLQHQFEFLQRANLNLNRLRAATIAQRAIQRRNNAARQCDVIVLDQNPVAQVETMIVSAAASDCVLVEHAQAGSSLAGVKNGRLRSLDGIDVLARERGDAAHALHDVQDDALAGENHTRVVDDNRDRLPFAQTHAVEDFGMAGDLGMRGDGAVKHGEDIEDAVHAAKTGEDAILLGEDGRRSALVDINAGVGGGIARGAVFEQRVFQNGRDAAGCPVHSGRRRLSHAQHASFVSGHDFSRAVEPNLAMGL